MCFNIREVCARDSTGAEVSWQSTERGSTKPQNTRPLALFPAKESIELLEEFVPLVEQEIAQIQSKGVEVISDGDVVTASCLQAHLSMADGKMVTNLLQLGGAYCTMCVKGQNEAHKVDVIERGFVIERSVENISELALSLTDPDSGDITKKKGDYEKRQGVCGLPITQCDLTKNIPVCHSKIRSFEFIIELLTRHLSHKKWYTLQNAIKYSEKEKACYKEKRDLIKKSLNDKLAINIGNPGDMVTGQAFQTFSSDESRRYIVSMVEDNVKENLDRILIGLCAAVKVINSQKRQVNVERLRLLTRDVKSKNC